MIDNVKAASAAYNVSEAEPFLPYYQELFSQDSMKVLYIELDPGVDDGAALLQLLAARINSPSGKKIEVMGLIATSGNVVLSQGEINALRYLELANSQDISVFSGEVAPLALQNNETEIEQYEKGINRTHFYGYDGESDVGGWPSITTSVRSTPGYQYAASVIYNSTEPLTLLSTSPLTVLAKTLVELENFDSQNGRVLGSFAKNINAISIMGGCIDPKIGCNAPFNVPNNQKTSEANFYIDPQAAQQVFSMCKKYGITILLAPLDLTQEPNLYWTSKQVDQLNQIGNSVAQEFAKVSKSIPWIDAMNFPNGTYPMHDEHAVDLLLFPQMYNVTRVSAIIGSIGQMIINVSAQESEKKVYILGMPLDKQIIFYQTVLEEYNNFNPPSNDGSNTATIISYVAIGLFMTWAICLCCKKEASNQIRLENDVKHISRNIEALPFN